jgi:UDP-GlcNAc:undecaprenyl-phosphate/decaprenyl-phosphate GlcNAc-1-phosphate transferase
VLFKHTAVAGKGKFESWRAMVSYAVAFLSALCVSTVLTPLIRGFSLKHGWHDEPNSRKVHNRPIPRTGGIAIAIAFLAPVLGIALTRAQIGQLVYENPNYILGIVVGGAVMMLVGLTDDLKGIRAKWKFLLQIGVATFAFAIGFRIEAVSLPLGGALPMGIFSYFITVFWIVGIINALNLVDGLDGLAGGISFLVLVFNFLVAYANNATLMGLVAASLAGAILGFLFYNFNPASIFMGDAGSMFIGYVLALASINSGQKSSTTVALLTPIVAMGLPIMDTLFSIVRRFLERRPIFSPDRGHIHHRLLSLGLNQRRTVLVLYGFAILLVVTAAILHFGGKWQIGVGLLLMVVTFFIFAKVVGVADYFTRRRAHRMGIRTPHGERLRETVFEGQKRAEGITDAEEATVFFQWLLASCEMHFVELYGIGNKRPINVVVNAGYPTGSREPLVTVRVPIYDAENVPVGSLRFGWHSERGKVTSVTETLLQVIADRLCASALFASVDSQPEEKQ